MLLHTPKRPNNFWFKGQGVKGGFLLYCLQGRDIETYSTKGQSLCPHILGSCEVS